MNYLPHTIALLITTFAVASVCAQSPPAADAPLATRQNFFTIPFTVPPASGASAPGEVQLLVSADRGQSWQLHSRQAPGEGKFQFRAAKDGEYWFASRTITRQGYPLGGAQPRAELRVLIDTVGPQLDVKASVGPAGEVQVAWQIADPNLVATSLKLFYRHNAADQWQPVAVDIPRDAARPELSGNTAWWPQRHGTTIEIRAEVQDRAGNANVVQRSLQLPSLVAHQPAAAPNAGVAWPADGVLGPAGSAASAPQPVAQNDLFAPVVRPPQDRGQNAVPTPRPAPIAPSVSHRADVPDSINAPRSDGLGSPSYEALGLPAGERPRMTRARRFNLEYDVEGIGPSGIARVELWATRNGGRLWERWGLDDDRASPIPVDVQGEGIYGFCIVVCSGNGLAGQPPKSGDPAEVWIGVDESAPRAEVTSAQYGAGQQVGVLSIFWEAQDSVLDARPVTLLFSDHPDGPWTSIAAGLPNDGRYDWQIDQRVPANIYLRLEVRDEAGNVGVHQLARPIANDGLIPRGRIRSVQPVE